MLEETGEMSDAEHFCLSFQTQILGFVLLLRVNNVFLPNMCEFSFVRSHPWKPFFPISPNS